MEQQQQQQQLTLKEGVNTISKKVATWESRAGVRDETKNAMEVEMAAGNSRRTVSKVDVGTYLSDQAVVTDALLKTKWILKKSKECKNVRTKFVFAKT